MPDIRIDLSAFESMVQKMATIKNGFDSAESFSSQVAGTTGHDGLAGKVDDFATKWNIHRSRIEKELAFVHDAVKSIHDTFVELDERLAAQLERTMADENK